MSKNERHSYGSGDEMPITANQSTKQVPKITTEKMYSNQKTNISTYNPSLYLNTNELINNNLKSDKVVNKIIQTDPIDVNQIVHDFSEKMDISGKRIFRNDSQNKKSKKNKGERKVSDYTNNNQAWACSEFQNLLSDHYHF